MTVPVPLEGLKLDLAAVRDLLPLELEAPSHNSLTSANGHSQSGAAHLKWRYCTSEGAVARVYRGQSVAVASTVVLSVAAFCSLQNRPQLGGSEARETREAVSGEQRTATTVPCPSAMTGESASHQAPASARQRRRVPGPTLM